jgi:hypothetical protein
MHAQDLDKISPNPSLTSPPLARRVCTPHRPYDPTWKPHGCTLSPSFALALVVPEIAHLELPTPSLLPRPSKRAQYPPCTLRVP